MKAILQRIAALYLCCASTVAFAGTLPQPPGSFLVGYNEAWFGNNFGTWLTSNPAYGLSSQFNTTLSVLDTWFAGMAKGNAKIVRIWAFPALQGIVLSQSSPQTQSLTSDFLNNLKTVLLSAKNHGLRVYVTALNGNDMKAVVGYAPLQNYFTNLLLDKYGEREAFKTNALGPLLKFMNQFNTLYPDVIYAFDLINEIEAPLNSSYFPNYWTGARDWIQNMTAFVKSTSPWLPVTSTAGWGYAVQEITFGLFSGLGLDFYDLHVYADSGQYSGETALCNKVSADMVPIILGEYGQNSQSYSDSIQYSATANFLYGAKTHCFSAALAWKYESSNQPWFTYLKPDGTFRPAYSIIQYYGTLQ